MFIKYIFVILKCLQETISKLLMASLKHIVIFLAIIIDFEEIMNHNTLIKFLQNLIKYCYLNQNVKVFIVWIMNLIAIMILFIEKANLINFYHFLYKDYYCCC